MWPLRQRGLAVALCVSISSLPQDAYSGTPRDGAVTTRAPGRETELAEALTALASRTRSSRPVQGRMTGVRYAPYSPHTSAEVSAEAATDLARAAVAVQRIAEDSPQQEAQRSLARLDLWFGRASEAIERFQSLQAPDWADYSDLGVALLARGEQRGSTYDAALALEALDEAAALEPGSAEVEFNRGLALDRLHLEAEAHRALSMAIAAEPESPWSAEAKEALDQAVPRGSAREWDRARSELEQMVGKQAPLVLASNVSLFPQQLRLFGEEVLLPRWAGLRAKGDEESAVKVLALVREVAAGLRERGGDSMLADAVHRIDDALSTDESEALESLESGHVRFSTALESLRIHDIGPALVEFESAEAALRKAGSPFAERATYMRALCLRQTYDNAGARKLTERLRTVLPPSYPALLGRAEWLEGLLEYSAGRPETAMQLYRSALNRFVLLQEMEHAGALRALIAEVHFDYLGDFEGAWSFLAPALADLPLYSDSQRRQLVLDVAGLSLAYDGRPSVALYYQNAIIEMQKEDASPTARAIALIARASLLTQAGRAPLAKTDLELAQTLMPEIVDPDIRASQQAYLDFEQAARLIDSAPSEAIRYLDAAIESYRRLSEQRELITGLSTRAQAHQKTLKTDLAVQDLEEATAVVGRFRASLETSELRRSLLDEVHSIFARLVDIRLRQGDDVGALVAAETYRATTRFSPATRPQLARAGLARGQATRDAVVNWRPERGLALVYYVLLEDRAVAWVITHEGRETRMLDRHAIVEGVDALARSVRGEAGASTLRAALGELFQSLVAPLEVDLQGLERLVVIPDQQLFLVPFAALLDEEADRFLVESVAVSISTALTGARPAPIAETAQHDLFLVAVGDPAFSQQSFPMLARLPGARSEASRIAGLYERSAVLTDSAASRSRFLSALGYSDVVHFAGHAVPNDVAPGFARLLLAAGEEPGGGFLFAKDIEQLRLSKRPLVFLSACESGFGRVSRSAGALSIARPFLDAGARAVISNLWSVEDGPSQEIAVACHRALRAGLSPAAALRSAQLGVMASTPDGRRSPQHWASFQVMESGWMSPSN